MCSDQNSKTSTRYIMKNAVFRLVKSEIHDQKIRPVPFPSATQPTSPAAIFTVALPIS